LQGAKGDAGLAAPVIIGWRIDRTNFVVTPVTNNGDGPPLDLRSLFVEYDNTVERG